MKQMPAPLLTLLADAVPNHFGSWNINATLALLVVQLAGDRFVHNSVLSAYWRL
ncbi:hypothetical protein QUA79_24805 [Microcoleus sp. F8-D1]